MVGLQEAGNALSRAAVISQVACSVSIAPSQFQVTRIIARAPAYRALFLLANGKIPASEV